MIDKINNNTWIIQGFTPIEEVEEALGIVFPEEEYDTFAGFILTLMPQIPLNKKNIKLKYENMTIKVTKTTGHKIETAIVQMKQKF